MDNDIMASSKNNSINNLLFPYSNFITFNLKKKPEFLFRPFCLVLEFFFFFWKPKQSRRLKEEEQFGGENPNPGRCKTIKTYLKTGEALVSLLLGGGF